jgi:hypothetical protein
MEQDLPTPASSPDSLNGAHKPRNILWEPKLGGKAISSGGYATWCAGTIQGKEDGIQGLVGLVPSSQTVGSNKRVINEQAKCSS